MNQPNYNSCPYCGMYHSSPLSCPRSRFIEFNPDGTVRKVKYFSLEEMKTSSAKYLVPNKE